MSKENEKKLGVYAEKAGHYLLTSQVHDNMDPEKASKKKAELENFLKCMLTQNVCDGSKFFEFGAGDGSNSAFVQSLGYDVTASDTAEAFINEIKEKGIKTIKFNVLTDEFPGSYAAIFCWRVFVHFTAEDFEETLLKVYDALEDGGIFIFNAINRATKVVDDEWVDFEGEYHMGVERYYKYYSEEEMNQIIAKTKFKTIDFHTEGGDNNNKWLIYVLKK